MHRPFRRALARTLPIALVATFGLAASGPSLAKGEKSITTLRVMLHPGAAARGTLPAEAKARIEAIAGAPVVVSGVTRTGALDLGVAGLRDRAKLQAIAGRLRSERSVLWAELAQERIRPKGAAAQKAAQVPGDRVMVRFADGRDAGVVLERLAASAGVPLAIERTIGAVHVVRVAQAMPMETLEALAKSFEADADVRYADPVRRARTYRVPNDPLFDRQWSLERIAASGAWDATTGSASVTVAVVDTGILDHPDLAGRLLPGYDFIADADRARDGDGRDDDPRDEGDWTVDGDCGGYYGQPSFFHGLFVAGQIAANGNNELGVAGLDWSAKILPVRVLGKCGGTFDDIVAGVMWAAGVPVEGAPANPNPAKIINLSLGGFGECTGAEQEAIDDALAQGTVIVAAAGNESDDASFYSPANCSGVITVGALGRTGERSSYSNFGPRIDLSAPGGDLDDDGLILSTHAAGDTAPGEFTYDLGMGTSFSAPLVSGTLSLMLSRNPNLTGGQALSILQTSSSEFGFGTTCGFPQFCGAGVLNAAAALRSTLPASVNPPQGAVPVVEFYDAELDHYLVTSDAAEIRSLETFGAARWQRTGHVFYAWADPSLAPAGVFPRGVCRFYAGPEHRIDAYWITPDAAECDYVRSHRGGVWSLQSQAAFWIEVPDGDGNCRDGTVPVYRFFNGRRDANQRHTIDLSVRRGLVNRGWLPDGAGADGAAMCSLI